MDCKLVNRATGYEYREYPTVEQALAFVRKVAAEAGLSVSADLMLWVDEDGSRKQYVGADLWELANIPLDSPRWVDGPRRDKILDDMRYLR
jgi:hypothetical protein